jgi:hypothetical protein
MMKMTYIYTQMGENKAKELGFSERKAGTVAYCGSDPVTGLTAKAWEQKGYITKKGDRTMKKLVEELNARGYQAEEKDVIKNGVTFKGIVIGNGYARPVLYPTETTTVDDLIKQYEDAKNLMIDYKKIEDPRFIRSHVMIGVQRTSTEDLAKKETEFTGIEQYLYVNLTDRMTFKLPKKMECEDYWESAKANTFAETVISTVDEALDGFGFPTTYGTRLYLVTNRNFYRGAANVLDRQTLREYFGHGDFVVIPSSVHEVLIFSEDEYEVLHDLADLIKEVNASAVAPEERLGDVPYKITL